MEFLSHSDTSSVEPVSWVLIEPKILVLYSKNTPENPGVERALSGDRKERPTRIFSTH